MTGDPFKLADAIRQKQPTPRFEGGEHAWLGMEGARRACKAAGLDPETFAKLQRRAGDVTLSYGEIVALSGDFYATPAALYNETPSPVPWLYEANDLSDVRAVFKKELRWIEEENRGAAVSYPDNNVALAWNAKSYVELALDNTDHFGWHNVVAYCRYHTEAIEFAIKAKSHEDELWRRALYYNAFADHFLTDGFAAGHIRIPRAEIRSWGKSVGYDEKLAGGLSKLLHDQDGHVNSHHSAGEKLDPHEGLPVRNSLGHDWNTRCDGQLFIVPVVNEPLVMEPVTAVAESLSELLTAHRTRKPVRGEYRALSHVPFPRPGTPRLAEKFSPSWEKAKVDALVTSLGWYVKVPWIGPGLGAEHVQKLFAALPQLMQEFGKNCAESYAESASLRERLPHAYAAAYSEIG